MPRQYITITEELRGKRIDKMLADHFPSYPRTAIHKLFEKGDVLLNGQNAKPGAKLRIEDKVQVDLSLLDVVIPEIDLPILYEDDDVLVVNKPAGIISHARGRYFDEASVASFVRQRVASLTGERAGIVHRLDRATSGVMICAKTPEAMTWLQKQFSDRKVEKIYVAIISGQLEPPKAIVDMPIERNPAKPQTFRVGRDGKQAATYYETVKTSEKYSKLILKPRTGRTHQLRVHMCELKHPIVGDLLYGGAEASRLFLHAEALRIVLPNKTEVTFKAPLPQEFDDLMKD